MIRGAGAAVLAGVVAVVLLAACGPGDPQPGGTGDPSVVLQVEQAVREAERAVAEVDRQSSGD